MAAYQSLALVKAAIMRKIRSAMSQSQSAAQEAMDKGMDYFYSGGPPVLYQRTNLLRNTPDTEVTQNSMDTVAFKAYLDDSGTHTQGSHPAMGAVEHLTNDGSYPGLDPAVGNPGYWDKSKEWIQERTDEIFSGMFSKS